MSAEKHLDTFWIYDTVAIGDMPEYQSVMVRRISVTGVTIQTSKGLHVLPGNTLAKLVKCGPFVVPSRETAVLAPEVRAPVVYQTFPLNDLSAALKHVHSV